MFIFLDGLLWTFDVMLYGVAAVAACLLGYSVSTFVDDCLKRRARRGSK